MAYKIELRRILVGEEKPLQPVRTSVDLFSVVYPILEGETQEVFLCVHLNARNEVLGYREVSRGTLTESLVHPREVFRAAIVEGAAAIVVAHNHPSGDPTPSRNDIETTHRLEEAAKILGIPLLDHIITGRAVYYSLVDAGTMTR